MPKPRWNRRTGKIQNRRPARPRSSAKQNTARQSRSKPVPHSRHGQPAHTTTKPQKSSSALHSNIQASKQPAHTTTKSRRASRDVWLGSTTGLQFEDVCCEILEGCGFPAQKIGGVGDAGRDIIIRRGRDLIVVECKHQANSIGRPVVQKLDSAADRTKGAAGGMIISTSGFSPQAKEYDPVKRRAHSPVLAIRSIEKKEILLIDRDDLRKLAREAGIRLHDGTDPALDEVDTDTLRERFSRLKSHPKPAGDLITLQVMEQRVDTCWVVKFRIEQDFFNSAGMLVHKMRKTGKCACGPNGEVLDGKFAAAVKKGGDANPKNTGTMFSKNGVVEYVKSKFTKNVRYKGSNGVSYTKRCEPSTQHVDVKSEPVGVKRTVVIIKSLRMSYKWILPDWGKNIKCKICGSDGKGILKSLLLCNDCGRTAHMRSCGGKCHTCKKTICDSCARKQSGLLRTRRLCSDCA